LFKNASFAPVQFKKRKFFCHFSDVKVKILSNKKKPGNDSVEFINRKIPELTRLAMTEILHWILVHQVYFCRKWKINALKTRTFNSLLLRIQLFYSFFFFFKFHMMSESAPTKYLRHDTGAKNF